MYTGLPLQQWADIQGGHLYIYVYNKTLDLTVVWNIKIRYKLEIKYVNKGAIKLSFCWVNKTKYDLVT